MTESERRIPELADSVYIQDELLAAAESLKKARVRLLPIDEDSADMVKSAERVVELVWAYLSTELPDSESDEILPNRSGKEVRPNTWKRRRIKL